LSTSLPGAALPSSSCPRAWMSRLSALPCREARRRHLCREHIDLANSKSTLSFHVGCHWYLVSGRKPCFPRASRWPSEPSGCGARNMVTKDHRETGQRGYRIPDTGKISKFATIQQTCRALVHLWTSPASLGKNAQKYRYTVG
jgi:hypothetical protein